jgi:hypothetical protein
MVLRSEYSLVHSEFNEFLFATVGEEKGGLQLTVLSALARLGFDPWEEAARLADLSQEAATSALTSTIAKLPEGTWKASDSRSIAARLVDSLPRRDKRSAGPAPDGRTTKQDTGSRIAWAALAAIVLTIVMLLQSD